MTFNQRNIRSMSNRSKTPGKVLEHLKYLTDVILIGNTEKNLTLAEHLQLPSLGNIFDLT
jgi:hypothetical protein